MENNVCKILGNNIKRIRVSRNLTQNKLAELLNIEVKSLSLIETGKGFASAKTIDNLARVLDISIADLFNTPNTKDNDYLYAKILKNLKLIKNNTEKLQTLELIVRNLV